MYLMYDKCDKYLSILASIPNVAQKRKERVQIRNVRLKMETYDKLEKYLLDLMQERGTPWLTLDDAVNSLLEGAIAKK